MIVKEQVVPDVKRLGADCVYMFLHHGWAQEARANRWHFATRWARHLPVIIVTPERSLAGRRSYPEKRIPNCRILNLTHSGGSMWNQQAVLQTSELLFDMRKHHFERPLLWLYNAGFAEAFSVLPAVARVHHATENYFDFPTLAAGYMERLRYIAKVSDLNVAVSDGCAKPLQQFLDKTRVFVATNGCDFACYGANVSPDPKIRALAKNFRRVAVFGGNINDRINYDLVRRAADSYPDILLVLVGRVAQTNHTLEQVQDLRARRNIVLFGEVDADRLPAIYRAADLGIIPYVHDRFITENGFPLKALEMAATGLPVVSTLMRPLLSMSPPLNVVQNDNDFLNEYGRAARSPSLGVELVQVAAQNDYDARFALIVDQLAATPRHQGARFDALFAEYPAQTGRAFADLLRGYRFYRRSFFQNLKYLFIARVGQIVDRMPESMRTRVITTKRAIFGGPTIQP